MQAVEVVMKMFNAMSVEEKKEVVVRIGDDGDMKSLVADVKSTATKKSSGKRSGGKARTPYWMRSVTGVDEEAKGFAMFDGDWVNDPIDDLSKGDLCVIGTREEPKKYMLCQRMKDSDSVSFEVWGKTQTVSGVLELKSSSKMSELVSFAKDVLE